MKWGRFFGSERFIVSSLVALSALAWAGVLALTFFLPAAESVPSTPESAESAELALNTAEIVELGAFTPLESTPDQELVAQIREWAEQNPGRYGVVVRELSRPQRTASYNAHETFVATSTYKLFLVYGVLHWVEIGVLDPDAVTSNGMTIEECIDSLLIHSWDECGWPLGSLVGWPQISDFLHMVGFSDTHLDNYDADGEFIGDKYSTPADQAEFAWRLARGELFSDYTHTELILSRLEQQIWQERIPAGVPADTRVANKPGWLYTHENDTAIVYGEQSTYVLAIMSEDSSVEHLAELSELVYTYLDVAE